jgi:hypothetical protein
MRRLIQLNGLGSARKSQLQNDPQRARDFDRVSLDATYRLVQLPPAVRK